MLTKIQASVMLLIGTVFAGFEIWQFVSPVSREIVELLAAAVFALLAVLFPAVKLVQAFKYNITRATLQQLKG